ncbi:hypothetical protein LCGC14_1820910 [marine sediment metagenome]|uniref:Uncharacterized protein n=1 Tax=marine sediment metagenome TaxID=412755 RepID=A0A0F9IYT9_9ZZZZ
MRINYNKLKRQYGDVGAFGFYRVDVDMVGEKAIVCIGIDTFRYQVAFQYEDGQGDVQEEYIDYDELETEGIDPHNLKAVALFVVERGESHDIHEGVGDIEKFLDEKVKAIA